MVNLYNAAPETERLIKRVYKTALKYFGQPDIFELEVEIVDGEEIREVNKETRGVDSVTDVLSFPSLEINRELPIKKSDYNLDIDPDSGKLMLGEILMCMQRILSQAEEYGHSAEREAGYLFLHGLLHLFGYDHMVEEDKKQMREKEEEILSILGITRG